MLQLPRVLELMRYRRSVAESILCWGNQFVARLPDGSPSGYGYYLIDVLHILNLSNYLGLVWEFIPVHIFVCFPFHPTCCIRCSYPFLRGTFHGGG